MSAAATPDGLRVMQPNSAFSLLSGGTPILPWGELLPLLELEPRDASSQDELDRIELAHRLGRELSLPPLRQPESVHVRTRGSFRDPGFRFDWTFRIDGHDLDPEWLVGAWYRGPTGEALLSFDSWRLWHGLSRPDPGDHAARQLWWAELRPLALAVGAQLEPFLRDSDARRVRRIRPVFEPTEDGGLHVRPTAEGVTSEDFDSGLGRRRKVRAQLNARTGDGGRKRLLLESAAIRGLEQIVRKPRYSPVEAATLQQNPEREFDPDVFDLTEFSDRVLGVGQPRYAPRIVIRTSESDTGWFEGVLEQVVLELTDEAHPEKPVVRIDVSEPEDRARAREAVEAAAAAGEDYCELDERVVRVTPDLRVGLAELPETGEPVEKEPSGEATGQVLLIRENVEVLEFGEATRLPEVPPGYEPPWPRDVQGTPHEHQLVGYRKLRWWSDEASAPVIGGLVADDMGLGKTFQVLSLLAALAREGRLRPSLVVAPASVLENWQREIATFIPDAAPRVVELARLPRDGAAQAVRDIDIVVTSYETLARRDIELGRIPWRAVVCDEAQKIKNPHTRAAHAAKAMKAELRVALTGTPVENSLDELWSIADFFQPGLLGSLADFRRHFGPEVLEAEERRERASDELRSRLAPVFLRRMKDEIPTLELPALERHEHAVEMSSLQRQVYDDARRAVVRGNFDARAAVMRMLQACAHPFPLVPDETREADPTTHCPKLARTLEILDGVRQAGEKAIVFVTWIDWQLLVKAVIEERFAIEVPVLNGSVRASHRQGVVDAFSRRTGFGVLVLSARACGTGLNITAANHVVHYTREWNPAIEAQATDRVHRIGQQRPVSVHLPIVRGDGFRSAEEILAERLREKEALRTDFIRPSRELAIRADELFAAAAPSTPEPTPSRRPSTPRAALEPTRAEAPLNVLATALGESVAFRRRLAASTLDEDALLRCVSVLAAAGGTMTADLFAERAKLRRRRVPERIARVGSLLNVDGYTVIHHDPSSESVVLDIAMLRQLFDLGD